MPSLISLSPYPMPLRAPTIASPFRRNTSFSAPATSVAAYPMPFSTWAVASG